MKKLFAEIVLNKEQLIESTCNRIEIEYYKISRRDKKKAKMKLYGVEIIKKEYHGRKKYKEKTNIYSLTNDESIINNLLKTLKKNKVTPIGLGDVIEEIL